MINVINEAEFDGLEWKNIEFKNQNDADKLFTGCTIIGAECIDFPCVDGLILYGRGENGMIKVFDISCVPFDLENENVLQVNVADIPKM